MSLTRDEMLKLPRDRIRVLAQQGTAYERAIAWQILADTIDHRADSGPRGGSRHTRRIERGTSR